MIYQAAMRGAAGFGGLLLLDTFTDTDGTSLNAHTPDVDENGTGWVINEGTITVQGNEAESQGSSWNSAYVNVGNADVALRGNIRRGGGAGTGGVGFLLRRAAATQYWIIELQPTTLRILERDSTTTQRASVTVSASTGVQYEVTASAQGALIEAALPAQSADISYASATAYETETNHGIFAFNTGHKVDDFRVDS